MDRRDLVSEVRFSTSVYPALAFATASPSPRMGDGEASTTGTASGSTTETAGAGRNSGYASTPTSAISRIQTKLLAIFAWPSKGNQRCRQKNRASQRERRRPVSSLHPHFEHSFHSSKIRGVACLGGSTRFMPGVCGRKTGGRRIESYNFVSFYAAADKNVSRCSGRFSSTCL